MRRLGAQSRVLTRWNVAVLASLALLLSGCLSPKYPVVSPYAVQVVGADTQGMALRTEFDVFNPNGYGLTLQTISGSVTLDNRINLGETTVNTPAHLPSHTTQRVAADLKVPWANLPEVVLVSQTRAVIPYTFKGRARVGGKISIEIPFTMNGQVTSQQIMQAGLRGVPVIPPLLGLP